MGTADSLRGVVCWFEAAWVVQITDPGTGQNVTKAAFPDTVLPAQVRVVLGSFEYRGGVARLYLSGWSANQLLEVVRLALPSYQGRPIDWSHDSQLRHRL